MKKLILIVEDHPDVLDLIRKTLEFFDYRVATAVNGTEAVRMASSHRPDLIIMDMLIPEMDGLEVTSRLRTNPQTKHIPILAATAKVMAGERSKCLAAGCDDYLAKPFTYKDLATAVENLLKDTERRISD